MIGHIFNGLHLLDLGRGRSQEIAQMFDRPIRRLRPLARYQPNLDGGEVVSNT